MQITLQLSSVDRMDAKDQTKQTQTKLFCCCTNIMQDFIFNKIRQVIKKLQPRKVLSTECNASSHCNHHTAYFKGAFSQFLLQRGQILRFAAKELDG